MVNVIVVSCSFCHLRVNALIERCYHDRTTTPAIYIIAIYQSISHSSVGLKKEKKFALASTGSN